MHAVYRSSSPAVGNGRVLIVLAMISTLLLQSVLAVLPPLDLPTLASGTAAASAASEPAPLPAGATLATPAIDPAPYWLPEELVGKPEVAALRSAESATFDVGGGQYALVQSLEPLHYPLPNGTWERIHPLYTFEANRWLNRTNLLRTAIEPRRAVAQLGDDVLGLEWRPQALELTGRGEAEAIAYLRPDAGASLGLRSADGATVRFPAAWTVDGIMDQWQAGPGRAEYTLRLPERPDTGWRLRAPEALELRAEIRLRPGTTLRVNGQPARLPLATQGTLSFVAEDGRELLLLPPAAFEQGNPDVRVAASYVLEATADPERVTLRVRTPWAWLADPARSYPVIIDPLFQMKTNSYGAYAYYAEAPGYPLPPAFNFGGTAPASDLPLGRRDNGYFRTALRFQLPRMRAGSTVSRAWLYAVPGEIDTHGADWLVANVTLHPITNDAWLGGQEPQLGPAIAPGARQMFFSRGQQTHKGLMWDITALASGWLPTNLFDPANNGVLLKADDDVENCDYGGLFLIEPPFFCGAFRFPLSSANWTFDDLTSTQYLSSPDSTYLDPNSRSTGVRLVVWYAGPMLSEGAPADVPVQGPFNGLPPGDSDPYFAADHTYQMPQVPNDRWQALYVRAYGPFQGPAIPITPGIDNAHRRYNNGQLKLKIQTGDNVEGAQLLDRTLAYVEPDKNEVSYVLFNGQGAPGQYSQAPYQARVISTTSGTPAGYQVGLIRSTTTISATTGGSVARVVDQNSAQPLSLVDLKLPPGANVRIDLDVFDNTYDFHYANLFKKQWRVNLAYATSRDDYIPSHLADDGSAGGIAGSGASTVWIPGLDKGPGVFTARSGQYGLALAYNGPELTVFHEPECEGEICPEPPERFDIVYSVQVRVTACPAGELPTSSGGCQRIECPNLAAVNPANYYRQSGDLGIWSRNGWNSADGSATGTSQSGSVATLVGPPRAGLSYLAPNLIVVGGRVVYDNGPNPDSVTVIGDPPSANFPNPVASLFLVDCPAAGGTPTQFFHVTDGPLKRGGTATATWLEPNPPASVDVKPSPWLPSDNDPSQVKNEVYRAYARGSGARTFVGDVDFWRTVGNIEGPNATLKFDVQFSWNVDGWQSFAATVAPQPGNPASPDIATLKVALGSSWSVDVSPFEEGSERKIAALRALGALVAQQDALGGASKPVQAVILPRNSSIPNVNHFCLQSCVDLRALDDAPNLPAARRNFAMPDVHTNVAANTVLLSSDGQMQVYSTDHPALMEGVGMQQISNPAPSAAADFSTEYSFDAYKAGVSIEQDYCTYNEQGQGIGKKVLVIKGTASIALPNIGGTEGNPDAGFSASFKLCDTPPVTLRQVHMEFSSPVGLPIGTSGMFLTGLSGSVDIFPEYTQIKVGVKFQAAPGGDGGVFRMTGEVLIDTRGLFAFQGSAKILGIVDATGKLWVAWNPMDVGFEVSLRVGDWLRGFARIHFWTGQGWNGMYSWLPDNDDEHFTGQIAATLIIPEGAIVDWALLVLPWDDIEFGVEVAFGEFCTNNSCTAYEWGIKGNFVIMGYDVGAYYGFGSGLDFILGNDDHVLIDQHGGSQGAPIAAGALSPYATTAAAEAAADMVQPLAGPAVVDATATIPFNVKSSSEQILVGLSWQAGTPGLLLVRPDGQVIMPGNAGSFGAAYDTNVTQGTTSSAIYTVQAPMPGAWQARIINLSELGTEHYKFIYLSNKGAPGTPGNRGRFTAPAAANENGTNSYLIRWDAPDDTPAPATISLYYSMTVSAGNVLTGAIGLNVPIVRNLPFRAEQYQWDTSRLASGVYKLYAVVDDGINDLPLEKISLPDDACLADPTGLPHARAFDANRFPGTVRFASVGTVQITDGTAPAAPSGLNLLATDGAIRARWNASPEKDVTHYLLTWVPSGGGLTNKQLVAAQKGATQETRLGAVRLGVPYAVVVQAIDASGNAGANSASALITPTAAAAPVPGTPVNLQVTGKSSTSAAFQWGAPAGTIPATYRLYAELLGADADDAPGNGLITRESAGLSATLDNLLKGRSYDVRAAACTADGWCSPVSDAVRVLIARAADGDGDGLSDDFESAHGVSDAGGDPDGDGLNNLGEQTAGTLPAVQDSDGDGLSDGEEVAAGTDPLDNLDYDMYTQPRLALSDDKLVFTPKKQAGGAAPPQTVQYANVGGGTLNLTAGSTAAWIKTEVANGNVQVSVDAATLPPGYYSDVIRLGNSGGSPLIGASRCIRVDAWVLAADADVAPVLSPRAYMPAIMRQQ